MKALYRLGALVAPALLVVFSISVSDAYAQEPEDTVVTEDVYVTAKKIAELTMESSKNITVVSREDIQNAPVENLQDLLGYFAGMDVKKRGPSGVQADVSIRGGSFEQILILIDGVKLSDPQTGHNNLNLPVNMDDIERIEILKGQASNIYGANALSGAINIITKKAKESSLLLKASGGEKGFYKGSLSLAYAPGKLSNTISLSREKSAGYRYNTGFDILTAALNSYLPFNSGGGKFSIGFTDKKFGANGFYSDSYPGQWERLKTAFSSFSMNYAIENVSISPKLYWRNNRDNYLLDFSRPDFYNNVHTTNSYGAELQSSWTHEFISVVLGGEIGYDDIVSTNLGNHNREKGGFSLSAVVSPLGNLKIAAGGFLYNYDNFGWKYWPGLDLSYQFTDNASLKASAGKSFCIPTFTELYYNSPAQTGNALLKPEEATSYETGFYYASAWISGSVCVFTRKGNDLIDWIRYSSEKPWQAENMTKTSTTGVDVDFSLRPSLFDRRMVLKKISLGYSYLNSDLKTGNYQSKYILDHLRHQFVAEIMHLLPFEVEMNWAFRYEKRLNQDAYFIADSKLTRQFRDYEFFLSATNLFNKNYLDFSGIPMPGRWIIGGLKVKFAL
ncbi:MAG: TonB-dependent receptor [Ignavibacteria bacterium]|jgi:iron complex outermembrane receptor protein|nr:TonB-dependent receptor [Ignavibacteria bacterium]MCU7502856.1 TonB-dependent receptor [Ignavibacteria bacterium]MCU7515650.1 TonB-dependent receptor [Ignavibacteria bacterium]